MLWTYLGILLLELSSSHGSRNRTRVATDTDERKLAAYLFTDYDPMFRPVIRKSDNITVKFGLTLNQIMDLDEKNQVMTSSFFVRQSWKNPLLVWNISDFGGINGINVNPLKVWTPDIFLYNNAHDERDGAMYTSSTKVQLYPDGTSMWLSPYILKTSCKLKVRWFPFDEQRCTMKFGSWTYNGFQLDLQPEGDSGEIDKFISNGEWDLISFPVIRNELVYKCCPEPYPDLTFTIRIRRRHLYYFFNIIIPCLLITSLTILSFSLPSESGERLTLVITNLLALAMFMLIIAEALPASEDIPIVSVYYIGMQCGVGLALIATCLSLKFHFINPHFTEMPQWLRLVTHTWITKISRKKIHPRIKLSKAKSLQNVEDDRSNDINDSDKNEKPKELLNEINCTNHNSHTNKNNTRTSMIPGTRRVIAGETGNHYPEIRRGSSLGVPSEDIWLYPNTKPHLRTLRNSITAIRGSQLSVNDIGTNMTHSSSSGNGCGHPETGHLGCQKLSSQLQLVNDHLHALVANQVEEEKMEDMRQEWRMVASMFDEIFFWAFLVILLLSTVVLYMFVPSYE